MRTPDKTKILIVDDNPTIRKMLRRILDREPYLLEIAEDGTIAIKKVSEFLPDVILLDVMMPNMDGFEVCKRLKNNQKYKHIYIIMLTAKTDADDEVAGLDLGADDYIAKPFNPETLLARIRRGTRLMKEKLDATFDPLTRLYNRRIFEILLREETARFVRFHHPLSLVMIDLDHFKNVNDTHGHQVGDSVLKEIADLLRKETRESDMAARWGGEEMVILLPETDAKGAKVLAENLRLKIENHAFETVGNITASFGVAGMNDDKDDLVCNADKALYRAKQLGRNQVVCDQI